MEGKFRMKDLSGILKESFKSWKDDDAFTHAAAISYYAIFSLPAALIILINAAGIFFGREAVQGKFSESIRQAVGANAAEQIQSMVANSSTQGNSAIMMIVGVIVLFTSATSLFMRLQKTLNKMWGVKTRGDLGILKGIFKRTKSLGITLVIGFLIIVSIAVTGFHSILSKWITQNLPDFTVYILHIVNIAVTFGISTTLFALLFKFLPEVRIQFKSVWIGAMVTSILFMIGQYVMTLYFYIANPASVYGVTTSIIFILLWVYYSCLLLFFGAEFIQSYAKKYHHKMEPSSSAIKVDLPSQGNL